MIDVELLDAVKLTIPRAAKRIGIGETMLRTIIRHGEIPVLVIGGKTVILARDLEGFLQGGYGRVKALPRPETMAKLAPLPKDLYLSPLLRRNGTK